jgi:hypothetical protein
LRAGAADEAHDPERATAGRIAEHERRRRLRFGVGHARSHEHPEEPSTVIARELTRSRRYGHPLALIGIVPPSDGWSSNEDCGRTIRGHVRSIDTVWASDAGIFILLPETDGRDANAVLRRLRLHAAEVVEGATAHVAAFPARALTAAALVEIARGRADRPPVSAWDTVLAHGRARRLVPSDPPEV